MTKQKLVAYINQEAGVHSNLIEDVQVFDAFSFVTVPFVEAEIIIQAFKNMGRDNRPLVTKAKGKSSGNSKGSQRGGAGTKKRFKGKGKRR